MIKYILIVLLTLFVFAAFCQPVNSEMLEEYQKSTLRVAYDIGETIEYRGQSFGETIASIVYQESKAGANRYKQSGVIVGDKTALGKYKSLGVMQIQIPAARDVLKWYPKAFDNWKWYSLTDEELIIALLVDKKFNIKIGSYYFLKMLELTKDWRRAILAFNRGANNDGRDPNDYVRKTLYWRTSIVIPLIKGKIK